MTTVHLEFLSSSQIETLHPLSSNSLLTPPPSLAATILSVKLITLGTSCKWIIQYLSFCVWLISSSLISLSFIHVVACIRISFLFCGWIIFQACICHILSIHLLMGAWVVSTFGLLWIVQQWTLVYNYFCFQFFPSWFLCNDTFWFCSCFLLFIVYSCVFW